MIYAFQGIIPVVHETAFVHPQAAVTGNVIIGRDCYIGPGAALRGDWGGIVIEDGCNVQENCTIHMFPGVTVVLEAGAHIGHGAIMHGARIGPERAGRHERRGDGQRGGRGGLHRRRAHASCRRDCRSPTRKVVVGNPARIVKDVSDEMLAWKTEGTALYQALPAQLHETLRAAEPLREVPPERTSQAERLQDVEADQ